MTRWTLITALLCVPSFVVVTAFTPYTKRSHLLQQQAVSDHVVSTNTLADRLIAPTGAVNEWECHKFGGASLATADLYRTVGDLLLQESAGRGDTGSIPTMAIVSAKGGMTDLLVQVVDSALQDFAQAALALDQAVESQIAVLKELVQDNEDITAPIEARFRQDGQDILSVVQSLRMLRTVPDVTMEVVSGYGEIWSAQTLHAYLQTCTKHTAWIDARDILVVKCTTMGLGEKGQASTGGVTVLWDETARRLQNWWQSQTDLSTTDYSDTSSSPIVVVTGFVAKTAQGVPTTLKRSGSDYSATIFAKLTDAARVTMWKNTDGVYTADPRRVPEAFPIASLKYDEAMELAYFGAQVLHPSAMEPCIDKNIPVFVRNIFNPSFKGTVIQGRSPTLREAFANAKVKNWRSKSGEIPIKGITSVDQTALVTLEGASIGGVHVAERFLGAMAANDITVLIITQASSESSITVAVPESQGKAALAALQDAFELELARSTINSVSLSMGMAIVAIVGEGMALTSGVSSTFMGSLSRANVNIRLIAQGSSERQIAVVVSGSDTSRALRAAHMAFTLSETTASVAILGSTGKIGTAFVNQLKGQKEMLAEDLGVAMSVNLAASSTKMTLCPNSRGIEIDDLETLLASSEAEPFDLERVSYVMANDVNPLRVIVDCTNEEHVSDNYERWLSSGINIISPGRKVGSGDLERYHHICQAQKENAVKWYVESSVGAALPIVTTLRDLLETGDKIKCIEGSLSGTMAYVLSTFSDSLPFSEVVEKAVEKGYTETNLCEDLCGLDMARKVVILARQVGLDAKLEDMEIDSVLPEEVDCYTNKDNKAVLEDLKNVDDQMAARWKEAEDQGRRLRYKFTIDAEAGTCRCALEAVANTDPLYRLKRNENLVAFATRRYETSPLIVKGAAAGPDLTAAGMFADLLRATRAYSSNQN